MTTESKPQVAKAKTKSQEVAPVFVIAKRDCPTDNYPFSVEQARGQLSDYLTDMYGKGYVYSGTYTQAVGSELVEMLVFYQTKS